MAPEAPGNLVILDLRFDSDGALTGTVEQVLQPQIEQGGWLRVRFHEPPERDFVSVGGGVAYVRMPPGYDHEPPKEAVEIPTLPNGNYVWNNVAMGEGLMLILILPKGFTLDQSSGVARSAKAFRERIAVYFRPGEKYGITTHVVWNFKKVTATVHREAERLRGVFVGAGSLPTNAGAYVDREDSTPKAETGAGSQPLDAKAYAKVSLVSFILGVALLVFYVWKVPTLIQTGTDSQVFYLLLFPWAFSGAAFLFGLMRSYARFRQKHLGSVLELGGPVVLFCLVLWGGFHLVPQKPGSVNLTVRAHSSDGADPLITRGKVMIDRSSREESFNLKGEAEFKDLAVKRGETVRLLPEVDGYKREWQEQTVSGGFLDIALTPEAVQALVDCSRPSRTSNRPAAIDFVNQSRKIVQVFWIDLAGQEEIFFSLEPGGEWEASTFVNHSWCVRDVDTRRALAFAVGTERPQRIILR